MKMATTSWGAYRPGRSLSENISLLQNQMAVQLAQNPTMHRVFTHNNKMKTLATTTIAKNMSTLLTLCNFCERFAWITQMLASLGR